MSVGPRGWTPSEEVTSGHFSHIQSLSPSLSLSLFLSFLFLFSLCCKSASPYAFPQLFLLELANIIFVFWWYSSSSAHLSVTHTVSLSPFLVLCFPPCFFPSISVSSPWRPGPPVSFPTPGAPYLSWVLCQGRPPVSSRWLQLFCAQNV